MASIAVVEPRTHVQSRTAILALWLIAAIPALFAVSTWSHLPPTHDFAGLVRYFSLPVVAVECAVMLYALLSGPELIKRAQVLPRWVLASLLMLAAIAIGTDRFVAVEKGMAAITTGFWFLHVGFALSVVVLAEQRWAVAAEGVWCAVLAGLLSYMAVATIFIATAPADFDWVAFNLGAINIRHTGPYAVIGFTAALGIGATTLRPGRVRVMVLCALLFAAFVFWSGTRAALLAMLATIAVGMLLFPILRTPRTLGLVVLSLTGGAVLSMAHVAPDPALGMFSTVARSQPAATADVSSGRIALWTGTVAEIRKRPSFGHGDSQVAWFVPVAKDLFNHPHNSILQFVFQWGLVGAAIVFALFGTMWARVTRAATVTPSQHLHAWLTVTAITVMSMVDGSLYFPYPVMMVAFAFAISEAMRRRSG